MYMHHSIGIVALRLRLHRLVIKVIIPFITAIYLQSKASDFDNHSVDD